MKLKICAKKIHEIFTKLTNPEYFVVTIVSYFLLLYSEVKRQPRGMRFVWPIPCSLQKIGFRLKFTLADLGGVPGARPPTGPNSFVFAHFWQKAPTSKVHAPQRLHAPLTVNPGSATDLGTWTWIEKTFNKLLDKLTDVFPHK